MEKTPGKPFGKPRRKPQEGVPEAGEMGRDRSFAAAESELPKWQLFLVTLLVFGAIQAIRFLTIGTLAPAGTGGTEVGRIPFPWRIP